MFFVLFLLPLASAQLKDNAPSCDCFVTAGKHPTYFQNHRFWDFRKLGADQYDTVPPEVTEDQANGLEVTPSSYLNSTQWNKDWAIQNWDRDVSDESPVRLQNSPANFYINSENGTTFLTLRTTRLEDFQSTAEVENLQKNLMYVSMRMYARVRGAPNACAGFFTYFDENNESDIEILTKDPKNVIRYSNQPTVDKSGNEITAASTRQTVPAQWSNWNVHRIDWIPGTSSWYINNQWQLDKTYGVPRKPSGFNLNMWSDGGVWTSEQTVGANTTLEIQWIEIVFNTSGSNPGAQNPKMIRRGSAQGCKSVCQVDGVQSAGFPTVLNGSSATGKAAMMSVNMGMGAAGLASGLIAIVCLILYT